jgi:UDP-N-acetylglucosamine 1-carboxyvinyltransferase
MISENITAYIDGGQTPQGKIKVSGAKNAATRLLAAALISDEKVKLLNFPIHLVDVQYKIEFIRQNGGSIGVNEEEETVEINPVNLRCEELDDYDFPIRTTYLLVAGMLKRNGMAKIPYPGGCKIGSRGYDLHIMVWQKMGATVVEKERYIEVTAPNGLKSSEISFPISTIGGTENALITASIIDGITKISNAYISPEVENLIGFLRSVGVEIDIVGNSYIEVHGKKYIRGSLFQVIPDRIEALTWIVYAALAGGTITIEDVPFNAMTIPLTHIKDIGIDFYRNSKSISVSPDCLKNGILQPFELACGTHPGVISDMQPFFTLLGLHANGISRIYDYRYPERIQYCAELEKIYTGSLKWEHGLITTVGKNVPVGNIVNSTDLRGSMVLIMAALLAKGKSEVHNAEMALRGYNNLPRKLSQLGVHIDIR